MTNRVFFVCVVCVFAHWTAVPAWAEDAAKAEDWLPAQKAACFNDKAIFTPYTVDERIANCTAAIESGKYDGETLAWLYNNRAAHHWDKKETDLAFADLAKALQVRPGFAAALVNRAVFNMQLKRLDDALTDLNQAIASNPDSYEAFLFRGDIYLKKGSIDLALPDANHTIDLNSGRDMGYALRGEIELAQGKSDAAITDFDTSLDKKDGNAGVYNDLCYTFAILKRDMETKALEYCNKSVELKPGDPHIIDTRGFLYLQLGRYGEAIKDYDAALAADPKLVFSLYGRGLARQREGDMEGAAADIAAAEAINPKIAEIFGTAAAVASGP